MAKPGETRPSWSTRKRDAAPRGLYRHRSGVWAIRFTCGAGHVHKEQVGPNKTTAITTYHARRGRARSEPSWCPRVEHRAARAEAKRRVRFAAYAATFDQWRAVHVPRSRKADQGKVPVLCATFGD